MRVQHFAKLCLLGLVASRPWITSTPNGESRSSLERGLERSENDESLFGSDTHEYVARKTVLDTTPELRSVVTLPKSTAVEKRALSEPQPLREPPEGASKEEQAAFIRDLKSTALDTEYDIPIVPSKRQRQFWRIHDIPVSATGYLYRWPDRPTNFVMRGLNGCTATFIVSAHGMWAGHLWESESGPGRGGAFNHVQVAPNGERKVVQRHIKKFSDIAINIHDQPTPLDPTTGRKPRYLVGYKSLNDLQTRHGDPFRSRNDKPEEQPQITVLTRAKNLKNDNQMYETKIRALTQKYMEILPHASLDVRTYAGAYKGAQEGTAGVVMIQYTPWEDGDSDCRTARVRIWYEDQTEDALDYYFERPANTPDLTQQDNSWDEPFGQADIASEEEDRAAEDMAHT